MILLFDENLSPNLPKLLAAEFPTCEHVRSVGLASASDQTIWEYAAKLDRIIVSKDSDFQHRALLYGPPPKAIWLRMGNGPTTSIVKLLCERRAEIELFASVSDLALLVLP